MMANKVLLTAYGREARRHIVFVIIVVTIQVLVSMVVFVATFPLGAVHWWALVAWALSFANGLLLIRYVRQGLLGRGEQK
jgi:hypothetical protein